MKRKLQFAAALAVALFVVPQVITAQENRSETYRQLKLFGDVFERVRVDYVEEVTDQELIEAAIQGMLSSLDPHSSYLNSDSFRDMRVQTKGEFGGLGIEVTMEDGLVKVVSPIDDTPAYRAGIEAGDLITHLNSEPVTGLSLNEAVDRMRGPVNTEIRLTIRRQDLEPFDVTIVRDVIRIAAVRSRAEGNIVYLRVTTFNEQTVTALEQQIKQRKEELGDKIIGYVLDLRNNPGGLLDQAIAVSDAFLERGEIVSTRGRATDDSQRYNARAGDLADGLPMVVLINGGSASASEIVAGALQDHRRAIVLGTDSFGKGSVQTIIPLSGNGAMRLTTARYYTPSGRSIQAKGIEPDILVEQARIEKLDNGEARREADLRRALDLPVEEDGATVPEVDPEASPPDQPGQGDRPGQPGQPGAAAPDSEQPGTTPPASASQRPSPAEDFQLARALDLLRGLGFFNARVIN